VHPHHAVSAARARISNAPRLRRRGQSPLLRFAPRSRQRRGPREAGMNLDTAAGPVLYLDGVTVSFDGFRALDGLTFVVEPGELRCVIGPNGAGKTTMMDVITGKARPAAGEVLFGPANELTRMSETEMAELGIGGTFKKRT